MLVAQNSLGSVCPVPLTVRGIATVGARPDLGDILRWANEELGADADVLIGGPQLLVDGLEDRLKGRVVERMTWAM